MNFSSPIKNTNGTSTINIETLIPLKIKYTSSESGKHTTPSYDSIDFKKYIGTIASMYETYSKKWSTRAIMSTIFLSKLAHVWNTGEHVPYDGINEILVYQEWNPEKIIIDVQHFTIYWKLAVVSFNNPRRNSFSGPFEITSDEILCDSIETSLQLQTTLRSRALHKVRRARLVSAVSKARADALTLRYYEKYGDLEDLDSNSVLSSDSEEK
jgi:hypothetical protein